MKLKRSSLSLLSLCLGLAAPAAAQQADEAPEAPQASATPAPQPAPEPLVPATQAPAPLAPIPDLRLYLANFSIVRHNPLGLESQARLILQKRMFDSEAMVLRDNFVSGALSVKVNPASLKVGPLVEFQPVAMLNVRAGYEFVSYLGTLGFLQSYTTPLADHSDDARDLTETNAYSTSGHHFLLEPTVQAKVRNFVVRSKLAVEYWNVDLREGDRATFYDATLDTLVPGKGWVLTNDTDLLMLATPQLTVGARFSAVFPKYGDRVAEGVTASDNSHMRVGPMAAYSFHTDEGTMFNKPTVVVMTGWYLKHQNRQEAMPYLLAGFGFTSDLMGGR
ncbi:hypothetical protein [Pyxidicoccus trucidator]|uniref:hypothetical protein n=1 Tax=Pyxidicoccus trucidator TaxID=2709662 RepID=UPI0013DAC639|nr:hypothetical protein [Pyxidicoccus trucidator]